LSYNGNVLQSSEDASNVEAVIDEGGNGVIPVEQLPRKYPPGTHLRVHVEGPIGAQRRPIEGALPGLPELSWEDFEAASRFAIEDAEAANRFR